jgi:superfamily II DNA helicase RecQ
MNIKVFNIRLDEENFQNDQIQMNEFLDSVIVKLTSTNFVSNGTIDYWSAAVFFEPKLKYTKKILEVDLTDSEKEIYNALKIWRNNLATKLGRQAFFICYNSHLISITKVKPKNIEELKMINNFGVFRTNNYGDEIISILNAI